MERKDRCRRTAADAGGIQRREPGTDWSFWRNKHSESHWNLLSSQEVYRLKEVWVLFVFLILILGIKKRINLYFNPTGAADISLSTLITYLQGNVYFNSWMHSVKRGMRDEKGLEGNKWKNRVNLSLSKIHLPGSEEMSKEAEREYRASVRRDREKRHLDGSTNKRC